MNETEYLIKMNDLAIIRVSRETFWNKLETFKMYGDKVKVLEENKDNKLTLIGIIETID